VRWRTSRSVLADLERDVAAVMLTQVEVLIRLKELRRGSVLDVRPDRGAALAELWQLRDLLIESDPDLAARLHAIYNALIVDPGPDAG
jgi:hypothetical protein